MTTKEIEQLIMLISKVVHEGEPWQDKRDSIVNEASSDDMIALEEFAAWFAPDK